LGEGGVYLNGPAQIRNKEVIIGGASAYDRKDIVGEGVVFILLDSFFQGDFSAGEIIHEEAGEGPKIKWDA
jgi:hypothetical protein